MSQESSRYHPSSDAGEEVGIEESIATSRVPGNRRVEADNSHLCGWSRLHSADDAEKK